MEGDYFNMDIKNLKGRISMTRVILKALEHLEVGCGGHLEVHILADAAAEGMPMNLPEAILTADCVRLMGLTGIEGSREMVKKILEQDEKTLADIAPASAAEVKLTTTKVASA